MIVKVKVIKTWISCLENSWNSGGKKNKLQKYTSKVKKDQP